jgi:hypothetical protein
LIASLAIFTSGCLLIAAGTAAGCAAGYAYYKGKVCQNFVADFPNTWAATHTALQELGLVIEHEQRTTAGGYIETRTADSDRVRIDVENESSRLPSEGVLTRVGIRVATFGDYPVSDRILYQIAAHLAPQGPPVAVPPGPPAPALGPAQPAAATAPPLPTQTPPPPALPPEPVRTR